MKRRRRFPVLLTATATAELLGLAQGRFYLIREASPSFPAPRKVPGLVGLRYLRSDVLAWAKSLEAVDERKGAS